jgi:hypothetical protein
MKKLFVCFIIIGISHMVTLHVHAARRYALGLDLIRMVDKNQDDGMGNVHGQIGLRHDTALTLGYAKGDNLLILESGIQYYFAGRFDGPFLQFGIGFFDHETSGDDFGFVTGLGYEKYLNEYLTVSWVVRMVAQVDEEIIGYSETPVFQPAMSIMATF